MASVNRGFCSELANTWRGRHGERGGEREQRRGEKQKVREGKRGGGEECEGERRILKERDAEIQQKVKKLEDKGSLMRIIKLGIERKRNKGEVRDEVRETGAGNSGVHSYGGTCT